MYCFVCSWRRAPVSASAQVEYRVGGGGAATVARSFEPLSRESCVDRTTRPRLRSWLHEGGHLGAGRRTGAVRSQCVRLRNRQPLQPESEAFFSKTLNVAHIYDVACMYMHLSRKTILVTINSSLTSVEAVLTTSLLRPNNFCRLPRVAREILSTLANIARLTLLLVPPLTTYKRTWLRFEI